MSYFQTNSQSLPFFLLLLFFLQLSLSCNLVLSYDPNIPNSNGLLRIRSSINGYPVNFIQNSSTQQQQSLQSEFNSLSTTHENQDQSLNISNETSPVFLNPDYELENDTNKTKRSKAALRWLKQTLGLVSSEVKPTSESDAETLESSSDDETDKTTMMPSSSVLSKLNPLNIKRKISSKVGRVYQTIAGAVGLGGSKGATGDASGTSDGSMGDEASDDMAAESGTRETSDDEGSSGADQLPAYLAVVAFSVILTVVLPSSVSPVCI